MTSPSGLQALQSRDLGRRAEPDAGLEPRPFLEAWLDYQRHEFLRKLRDLTREQLVAWAIPPVELSVMGLVRHMTQMEHGYVSAGLGGGELVWTYGDDDFAGASVDSIDDDLDLYFAEMRRADAAIASMADLETIGKGHGRSLRAVLVKMLDEYALHAGQAHMLRFAALGEMRR